MKGAKLENKYNKLYDRWDCLWLYLFADPFECYVKRKISFYPRGLFEAGLAFSQMFCQF